MRHGLLLAAPVAACCCAATSALGRCCAAAELAGRGFDPRPPPRPAPKAPTLGLSHRRSGFSIWNWFFFY
jgi:hypothetical protein